MVILYLLSLLPICVGCILHLCNKQICWKEWILGSIAALGTAGLAHWGIYTHLTYDVETWSGQITSGTHNPAWTEQYQEAIYKTVTRTDPEGKTYTERVFSHYETRTKYHPEVFTLYSNINSSHLVNKNKWLEMVDKLGKVNKVRGSRSTGRTGSHMISGDPYDYNLQNVTGWIEPVNIPKNFANPLKHTKTVYSFYEVPEERQAKLFAYPTPTNGFTSKRLLGVKPAGITQLEWDQLNARLGPIKKVNLILVGFSETKAALAEDQIALWEGGKKNDLILMFGPGWSRVKGWSPSELTKLKLQSLLLEPEQKDLIPQIESLITQDYEIADWDQKVGHISIEPTFKHILGFLVIICITQTGLYFTFHRHQFL